MKEDDGEQMEVSDDEDIEGADEEIKGADEEIDGTDEEIQDSDEKIQEADEETMEEQEKEIEDGGDAMDVADITETAGDDESDIDMLEVYPAKEKGVQRKIVIKENSKPGGTALGSFALIFIFEICFNNFISFCRLLKWKTSFACF